MKTSVYVPDELWGRVLREDPEASASQILQAALRDRFEPKAQVHVSVDRSLSDRQAKVIRTLHDRFSGAYELGYSIGITLLERIPAVDLLWVLASSDFDLERFRGATAAKNYLADDGHTGFDFDAFWAEIAALFPGVPFPGDVTRISRVTAKGIEDALRSSWYQVAGPSAFPEGFENAYVVEMEGELKRAQADGE